MDESQVEEVFRDCLDPEDEDGFIPYNRKFVFYYTLNSKKKKIKNLITFVINIDKIVEICTLLSSLKKPFFCRYLFLSLVNFFFKCSFLAKKFSRFIWSILLLAERKRSYFRFKEIFISHRFDFPNFLFCDLQLSSRNLWRKMCVERFINQQIRDVVSRKLIVSC